jgi:hypothetical protein
LSMLLVFSIINTYIHTEDEDSPAETSSSKGWEQTAWLPKQIDRQFKELAKYRNSFVKEWSHGGSSIDLDVTFKNIGDMITYIPRSVQISFLSPFPNIWFTDGKKAAGSAMRIAASVEMMISYFCLLGLPGFIKKYWREPAVWVTFFVCTSMLIIYAMIVPNQGALYRFRYPYYMPLICFGLAGWISKITPHTK